RAKNFGAWRLESWSLGSSPSKRTLNA
ncbi:hypothetical protein L195_g064032, partial [Trifolium pratense]